MQTVSKLLQAVGIAEVMTALLVGIGLGDMRSELLLASLGVVFFTAGWLLGRRGKREEPSGK